MRRFILFLFGVFTALVMKAQLTASDDAPYTTFTVSKDGYDIHIYMFNGIENTTEFDAGDDNVSWYTFNDLSNPISSGTRKLYGPADATGYVLDNNGTKTYIWVFDYKNYSPVFSSFKAEDKPLEQCENLSLQLAASVPELIYKSPLGVSYKLDRTFTVSYNTLEWTDTWNTVNKTFTVNLPKTDIPVDEAPLCSTIFKISGDEYATMLSIDPAEFNSDIYTAVAVDFNITSETVTRSEKNEGERPDQSTAVSGSSPLEILFKSNANLPVALYYNWTITKNNELLVSRTDMDHRFTFVDAGTYNVKLTVSNDYCSKTDSMTITVSTSALEVPNVFTPDGNGLNDEFRVGYKSLETFECWVFNRWGRKVYYWNDPQKGWDGNINGKPASTGAYFYITKAKGADGKEYKLKGDINLLRGKEGN